MDYPAYKTLLSFSDEVLLLIFRFLGTEDKILLSQVCRRFDSVLFDKRLNRDFEISPKHNDSSLKHVGSYLQHRRPFIYSFNINSCDRIPMKQINTMTKGLTNLRSLHVMNIFFPVSVLCGALRQSMQIEELSWTWKSDDKNIDETWTSVLSESKEALSKLKRLHICVPDPFSYAMQKFLIYCSGLAYLTLQIDPALRKLPTPKNVDNDKVFTFKLKSFCGFQVSYGNCIDTHTINMIKSMLDSLLIKVWNDTGGFSNSWETFWPFPTTRLSENFPKFVPKFKYANISTSMIPEINQDLEATDLTMVVDDFSLPEIHELAPKVEKLTIQFAEPMVHMDSITLYLERLKYLVELNLVSVHVCRNNQCLSNLWTLIKSFASLRKLAVESCAITGLAGQSRQGEGNLCLLQGWSERINLDHLEVFQLSGTPPSHLSPPSNYRCRSFFVMPSIGAISTWNSLTSLTFDSIPLVRKFDNFRSVAQVCVNLEELRFREIGHHGLCMYIKDVSNALPYFHNLKNFSVQQGNIADFLKDLLLGLSHCPKLESVCIYNSNALGSSSLKGKDNLQETILNLIKKCQFLKFIRVPLPYVSKNGCNKMKKCITKKLDNTTSNVYMEFCEKLCVEDQYLSNEEHTFPPDVLRLQYMRWKPKVCAGPHECD